MAGSSRAATPQPSLGGVGERRRLSFLGFEFSGKRRRPLGEKPALPRPLQAAGWLWVSGVALVAVAWILIYLSPAVNRWWYRVDHELLHGVVDRRSGFFDGAAKSAAAALTSVWAIRVARLAAVAVLVVFRRWQRLMTAVVITLLVEWVVATLSIQLLRERPLGVETIIGWSGPSHPSVPMASLTVTLVVILMALVPAGRLRRRGAVAATILIVVATLARIYGGVDHPSDALFAVVIAGAIAIVGFRLLAPDPAFPVSYRLGTPAHLDVTSERAAAIRSAARGQAGLEITDIEPWGLAGSAGSTPLRLGVGDGRTIFAKLYTNIHLRSDRWYKAARTVLYGALEDEVRFGSVSRLVEREDYLLRLMRSAGVACPEPYGFLEIVPDREYVLITEFVVDAHTLDDVEFDDELVTDCLEVVRDLWDAGVAHRDIKPSNVLVRQGRAVLVDVAFATARPTAWRRAVDLANMMLILGLHVDPQRVYNIALAVFAPEDIAEALASTHGVTMPSELRRAIEDHRDRTGVDLVDEFRRLAPDDEIIHLQRWSARRIGVTLGTLAAAAALVYLALTALQRAGILL